MRVVQDQFKHSYRQTVWSLPGGYLKSGEHPGDGLERDSARLDLCYVGKFIGGHFSPSSEVTEYGFFSFENLPIIATSQLYLIENAINASR